MESEMGGFEKGRWGIVTRNSKTESAPSRKTKLYERKNRRISKKPGWTPLR